MRTPCNKQSRFRPKTQKATVKYQPDLKTLKNKAILTEFTNNVTGKLLSKSTHTSDVHNICSDLIKTISSSVNTYLPPKPKQTFHNIWKDDQQLNICYNQLNSVCKTGRPTDNSEA